MAREAFPYLQDRVCIAAFLDGDKPMISDETYDLANGADKKLRFNGEVIAWFDTAGALVVKLLPGWQFHYSRAIIDEIAKQLGIDASAHQEAKELDSFGKVIRTIHYYIDNQSVALGDPFVLLDGLGVMAYRAAKGVSIT